MRIQTLVGPVEPLIRAAIFSTFHSELDLLETDSRGLDLIEEALALGIRAVITQRDDLVDIAGALPSEIVALGISCASWDVLVARGSDIEHLSNPAVETLGTLISRMIRPRP